MKAKEVSHDIDRYEELMVALDDYENKVVAIRRELEEIRNRYKGIIEF